jgi:hypothetical protein
MKHVRALVVGQQHPPGLVQCQEAGEPQAGGQCAEIRAVHRRPDVARELPLPLAAADPGRAAHALLEELPSDAVLGPFQLSPDILKAQRRRLAERLLDFLEVEDLQFHG